MLQTMKRGLSSHVNCRASLKTVHQKKKLERALNLDRIWEVSGSERKITMSVTWETDRKLPQVVWAMASPVPTGSLPTVAVSPFTPQSSSNPPGSSETPPSGFASSHSPQFALTYLFVWVFYITYRERYPLSQLSTHTDSSGKDQHLRGKRLFLLCSGHSDISYFVYFFFS